MSSRCSLCTALIWSEGAGRRTLLIAPLLVARGVSVRHLLKDGSVAGDVAGTAQLL